MGLKDEREKQELNQALDVAWKAWTEDVKIPITLSPAIPKRKKHIVHSSILAKEVDEQLDFGEVERERHMAIDDFDDGNEATQCDIPLNVPHLSMANGSEGKYISEA